MVCALPSLHAAPALQPIRARQLHTPTLPALHLTIPFRPPVERGPIERVRSSVDRRSQQVLLTEILAHPRRFELARHAPTWKTTCCLTTGERAMLTELLDKVASYADKIAGCRRA